MMIILSLCRALKEEKLNARKTIVPVLQAEEDERWITYFLLHSFIQSSLVFFFTT